MKTKRRRPVLGAVFVCGIAGVLAATASAQGDDGPRVEIETGEPAAIVRPGQTDAAELALRNPSDESLDGVWRMGVRRRSDASVDFTREEAIELAAGETMRKPLPDGFVTDLGMYYLDWEIEADGDEWTGVTSFAHMDPVGATDAIQPGPLDGGDEFLFGIAGGIRVSWPYDQRERFLEAAAIIGCEAYRMDMSWNHLQPDPDTWRWQGLDETVDLAEEYGMFIQPLVAYGTSWAVSDETRALAAERGDENVLWQYPPQLEYWSAFTRALAERYGTRMQYYEMWNEPDIFFFQGKPDEYVALLQRGYEEIKAVDPDIIVTTAGFTSFGHPEVEHEFHEKTFTDGADYFDAVAWHRHGDFDVFQREIDGELLPLLEEKGLGDVPLVFNESAAHRGFEGEWELAEQVMKKMTFSWARGAIGHYWYNLSRSAENYQMLNPDWTPRPSYPAYNELARLLRGRSYSHELDLGEGRWGFAFRGEGSFTGESANDWVLAVWTENPDLDAESFELTVSAGAAVERSDVMGNREALPAPEDGVLTVEVDHEPAYILIEDSSQRPEVVGQSE